LTLFESEIQQTDARLLERVHPRVTNEMNEALLKPYTAGEVKAAMFSIGDYKAPGLTVFTLSFSKNLVSRGRPSDS
jgi:hypothetical protein